MSVTFNIKPHSQLPKTKIVEILVDGKMAGVIYPDGEEGVKLISAHITESETEEGFAGEVIEDDGSKTWPPIPAILVRFKPTPYTIVGNRIVKQSLG